MWPKITKKKWKGVGVYFQGCFSSFPAWTRLWRWIFVPSPSTYHHRRSVPWWRHQMEICSALLALCAENSPVTGEFPSQRPVTWSFDVFFDLHLNKRLSKQSRRWWFETLSRSLWRHCNGIATQSLRIIRHPWDGMTWKHLPHYWFFVGESPSQGTSNAEIWCFFVVSPNDLLNKQ